LGGFNVKNLVNKIRVPIDSIKETSWLTIILFSLLYCIFVAFINFVVFKANILNPISDATLGLINRTLIANSASIIIFAFIIILMFGRLGYSDIGFKRNRLLSALAAVAAIWVSFQLINIIFGLVISGKPIINSEWSKPGVTNMLGILLGQLFGNCLNEEIAFRGFLMVQVCKKLGGTKGRLFTGVVLSQLLFSLIHIPIKIMSGMNGVDIFFDLILLLVIGILFAAIYLLTDNLFLAIGIHVLWNAPTLIFSGLPGQPFIFVASIILLIIWNRSFGKIGSKADNSLNVY
jgi:membrane protease YdiL (CAAX protease family)